MVGWLVGLCLCLLEGGRWMDILSVLLLWNVDEELDLVITYERGAGDGDDDMTATTS
jgi:hypothetical protein